MDIQDVLNELRTNKKLKYWLENRDKKGRRLFAQCNQRNEAPQDGRYSRQDRIEVRPFVPNPKGFSAVKQEKFIYGHTFLSY